MAQVRGFSVCLAAAAFAVVTVAIARYVWKGQWEANLPWIATALFGFAASVAAGEVADYLGFYGWSHRQYRRLPEEFIRISGWLMMAVPIYGLFLRP